MNTPTSLQVVVLVAALLCGVSVARADDETVADACTRISSDIERAEKTRASAAEQDANAWKTVLPFIVIAKKANAKSTIDYADKQLVHLRSQAAREGCDAR